MPGRGCEMDETTLLQVSMGGRVGVSEGLEAFQKRRKPKFEQSSWNRKRRRV